VAARFPD